MADASLARCSDVASLMLEPLPEKKMLRSPFQPCLYAQYARRTTSLYKARQGDSTVATQCSCRPRHNSISMRRKTRAHHNPCLGGTGYQGSTLHMRHHARATNLVPPQLDEHAA